MSEASLLELLGPDSLFRNAVVGGLLVAVGCAALGVYVALRRIVLVGVALPQVAAAGVALVFWWTGHGHAGGDETHALARLGAVGATGLALAALVVPRGAGSPPAEWRVGALLAISMSATILLVALHPRGDLELTALLRGDLLAIPDADLCALLVAFCGGALVFTLFRRELLLASFDPEYASTLGLAPGRIDALFFALLGVAVGLGVMTAGPLVVFGSLVLPPLAALRIGRSLASVIAIALGVAAISSLGGFWIAYRADLPAGPTSVAAAAALWLVATLGARLQRGLRGGTAGVLLMGLASAALVGCATTSADEPAPPLSRGSLPELAQGVEVSVLPFHNATGERLRIPSANPLPELARAAGDPFQPKGETVADRLQAMAARALARRGIAIRDPDETRSLVSKAPATAAEAANLARSAGLEGAVLHASLGRFSRTGSDLLLVQLDLVLVDPGNARVLWTGSARGPFPVRGALTLEEVLLDIEDPLFEEAFGDF